MDKWNTLSNETKLEIWQKFDQEHPNYWFELIGAKVKVGINGFATSGEYPILLGASDDDCDLNGEEFSDTSYNINITPLIEWADKNGYFNKGKVYHLGFGTDVGMYFSGDGIDPSDIDIINLFKLTYINGDLRVEKIK